MNAEPLYQDLLKHLQEGLFKQASTSAVHLAGLAIGGAWIANRLSQDLGIKQYGVINISFHRDDYAEKELKQLKPQTLCPLICHLMSITLILC